MSCIHRFALTLLPLLALTGCKVSQPGRLESAVAHAVKQDVTVGGKHVKNPLPPTDNNLAAGEDAFLRNCAICHGADGKRTDVAFAAHMSPPVPLLTSKDVQDYSDGQLKWIVENGISPSGMPAWKGILSDAEIWRVVLYLRRLPQQGTSSVK